MSLLVYGLLVIAAIAIVLAVAAQFHPGPNASRLRQQIARENRRRIRDNLTRSNGKAARSHGEVIVR